MLSSHNRDLERHSQLYFWFLALAVLSIGGCKGKVEATHLHSAPPAEVAGDEFLNSGEGFTIALPSFYKRSASTPDPDALFHISRPMGMSGSSPSATKNSSTLALMDTSVKYLPTDPPVMVRFETSTVEGGTTAAAAANEYADAVYGTTHATVTPLTLPIGEVMEITARKSLISGDNFYFVDFIVVDGESVLKAMFIGNDAKRLKAMAEKAMGTLRFDPNAHTKVQEDKGAGAIDMSDPIKGAAATGAGASDTSGLNAGPDAGSQ